MLLPLMAFLDDLGKCAGLLSLDGIILKYSPTPQGLSLNDPSDSQFHPRGHNLDHCRIRHVEFLKIMRNAFLFVSYGVLIRFSYCLTVLLLTCPPNRSHMELYSALSVTCCGVFSCSVLFQCVHVCALAHRTFRGQLGRVSSVLSPLRRFWGSHSGHWTCTARTFTHNPSCLPHMLFLLYRTLLGRFTSQCIST